MSSKTTGESRRCADKRVGESAGSVTPKLETTQKIFYIAESLLAASDDAEGFTLEYFYHPGAGKQTLFATSNATIMELIEHDGPHRSWFIGNKVCANGSIYITTPLDSTLLVLHQLRKHCTKRALALDSIHDDEDASVSRLLTKFVQPASLSCVTDVKCVDDIKYYKYNEERTLAWLALKTRRVAAALAEAEVHCGQTATSQNYTVGETAVVKKNDDDEYSSTQTNRLRMACDLVGTYLDRDLYEALEKYLALPSELKTLTDELAASSAKRKSDKQLNSSELKKMKLADDYDDVTIAATVIAAETQPLKERMLSTKEKALAKSAKGTKSISSFFTKK